MAKTSSYMRTYRMKKRELGETTEKRGNGRNTPSGYNLDDIRNMSAQEFVQFMDSISNIQMPPDIRKSPHGVLQQFSYAVGNNDKPNVVTDRQFSKVDGATLYRTVNDATINGGAYISAKDICQQTMSSDVTRYGSGALMGDGFYFSSSRSGSAIYGYTKGDVDKTAIMRCKLSPDAKLVNRSVIYGQFRSESLLVKKACGNNIDTYALWKGYDGIKISGAFAPRSDTYVNILNRNTLTFSSTVKPK